MKRLNIGLGFSSLNSTIRFENDREVDIEMTTASVSGLWLINEKLSFRGGIGVIIDGTLNTKENIKYDVLPGGIASLGLEYVINTGDGLAPFIDISGMLGFSFTKTQDQITSNKTNYFGSDLRISSRAGWNINNKIFPYISARVFGGPVNWKLDGEEVIGSDIHHYQLAVGGAFRINSFSVYAEWAGLGEKALSVGFSLNI